MYLPGYWIGKPTKKKQTRIGQETWKQMLADEKVRQDTINAINVMRGYGYSDATIAGILGNTWTEGQNRDTTRNPKRTRRGFFQQLNPYADYVTNKYGNTLALQMAFIRDWDHNPKAIGKKDLGPLKVGNKTIRANASDIWYKPRKWNTKLSTPEAAAQEFLEVFERAKGLAEYERLTRARTFYNWMQTLPKILQKQIQQLLKAPSPERIITAPAPAPAKEPVDNLYVKPSVLTLTKPTAQLDPAFMSDASSPIYEPDEQDNFYTSVLPPMSQAMTLFPEELPYIPDERLFLESTLLPGAKDGKSPGIHIKPSHRGRFTRYLKAHPGMTAEKASHSKNKHVAAMARFALAAKHWKH